MIFFPKDLNSALQRKGSYRAGSTDLWDLRRKGLHRGDLIDLRDVAELHGDIIRTESGGLRIPAMMPIARLAAQSQSLGYTVLTQAASELATPAIRNVATVGGNLMQEIRCSYFRSGVRSCLKTGGETCAARVGEHRYLSAIDLGGCIATHPSTLAMTFAALGATVICTEQDVETEIAIEDLWLKPQTRLLHAIILERIEGKMLSAWHRISNRVHAEWPLVEVALAISVDQEGLIHNVMAYAGGVAKHPFPIFELVSKWKGQRLEHVSIDKGERFLAGYALLPQSKYKDHLLTQSLRDALAQIQEQK